MSALHTTDFFCFYCGTKLPYGSSFCSQCGRQVVNEFLPNEVPGDNRQKSAKAQKKPIAVGVIFLLCGLLAIVWSILLGIRGKVPFESWGMELAIGCSILLISLYVLFFYKRGYFLVFISMLILAGRYVYLSIREIHVLVECKGVEIPVSDIFYVYVCGIVILAVFAIFNLIGVCLRFRKKAFRFFYGLSCVLHAIFIIFASCIWIMMPSSVKTFTELAEVEVESIMLVLGGNFGSVEILYYLPVDIAAIFLINRIAMKYIVKRKRK